MSTSVRKTVDVDVKISWKRQLVNKPDAFYVRMTPVIKYKYQDMNALLDKPIKEGAIKEVKKALDGIKIKIKG